MTKLKLKSRVDVAPSRAQHGMTKSSDTTHTQSQWTTKGVMSWQPEQSGHAQLPTNQNTKSSQSHSSKPHTKSGGHVKQIVS